MTADPATERRTEAVADTSGSGRQTSLADVAADGTHQTTLAEPVRIGDREADDAPTVVNAFPMGDVVLVRHYFEGAAAFAVLERYYDRRTYRFEIPRDEFRAVRAALAEHGWDLRLVEDVSAYGVVVRKYTDHPAVVFEDAVARFSADGFNVFVLRNESAVEAAVDDGAIRLEDAPVEGRFPDGHGTGPLTVRDVAGWG